MDPPVKTAICIRPRLKPSLAFGTTVETSAVEAGTVPVTLP